MGGWEVGNVLTFADSRQTTNGRTDGRTGGRTGGRPTFGVTVRVDGVVRKSHFVAFSCCVHNKVCCKRQANNFSVYHKNAMCIIYGNYLILHVSRLLNPFTPRSDQFQISPAASPEIYHAVRRTWLFIAYRDEGWLFYQSSTTSLIHFSLHTVIGWVILCNNRWLHWSAWQWGVLPLDCRSFAGSYHCSGWTGSCICICRRLCPGDRPRPEKSSAKYRQLR